MKRLLFTTGMLEFATGLALLVAPSILVSVLLGASLDTAAGLAVSRVAGAALLAFGLACWLASRDERSRAAKGLIAAALLYNTAVIAVLVHANVGLDLSGAGLWPAVALHAALAVCCVACLWNKSTDAAAKRSAPIAH